MCRLRYKQTNKSLQLQVILGAFGHVAGHLHWDRQDLISKVVLGKVDHMTNCTWIGPAVIIQFFLQVILGTVGHVTICVMDIRQDIIFKVFLGKVDHMTNCTWIGPAVIIQFFLQVILVTVT